MLYPLSYGGDNPKPSIRALFTIRQALVRKIAGRFIDRPSCPDLDLVGFQLELLDATRPNLKLAT